MSPGLGDAKWDERPITDHADAFAQVLERCAKKLRTGACPEDVGPDVVLLGRMMSRRT